MKNEELIFEKFNPKDSSSKIVELHHSIFQGTKFEDNLIYFDSNFVNYLEDLIHSKDNFFYVVKINGMIEGFLHIRCISVFLFLNNIAISNSFSKKGLGKKLLKFALKDIEEKYDGTTVFKLDVFKSNTQAYTWYQKLGFKVEYEKTWFELINLTSDQNKSPNIIEKRDINKYLGLYAGDEKIATVIKENLVLHRIDLIAMVAVNEYKTILTDDVEAKEILLPHQLELVDVAVRMKTQLKYLIAGVK